MSEDMISVIDAARQLEKRKATIFKVMKRLGVHGQKRRDLGSGNQVVAYITQDEFSRVRDGLLIRTSKESDKKNGDGNEDGFISAEIGVFYLIQLEPNHDPLRFKVGFAANIGERHRTFRCSAPFSSIVKTWPCLRLWEKTAIDCVTAGCERLHTEVFRSASLEAVSEKCDKFFSMMPTIP